MATLGGFVALVAWLALVHGKPAKDYDITSTDTLCWEFERNQTHNLQLNYSDYRGNAFFDAIANGNFTFLGIETVGRVFARKKDSPHLAHGWLAAVLQQVLCVLKLSHNVTFVEVEVNETSANGTDSASTKCWRKVIDEELNFCVGDMWETQERLAQAEFTSPIAVERVYTITEETSSSSERRPTTWFKVFDAFDVDVWCWILAHSLLLGFVISLVEVDIPSSCNLEDWKRFGRVATRRFLERPRPRGLLWLMGNQSRQIKTRSGGWLALVLGFYVLVVMTTYTGKVASDLTRATTTYFVDSMDNAVENQNKVCILDALKTTVEQQFNYSARLITSVEYTDMYKDHALKKSKCRVFLGADTSLSDYYEYTDCNLTAINPEFWIPLGWPCRPTALCNVLSILIADLREHGYILDEQNVAEDTAEGQAVGDCNVVSTGDDSEPLSLTSFWGFFELTWMVMGVTFVVTVFSRYVNRYQVSRADVGKDKAWPEYFRDAVYADENQDLWDDDARPNRQNTGMVQQATGNQVLIDLDLTRVRGKLTDPDVVGDTLDEFSRLVNANKVVWEDFREMSDADVTELGNVMILGDPAYVLRQALHRFHTRNQVQAAAPPASGAPPFLLNARGAPASNVPAANQFSGPPAEVHVFATQSGSNFPQHAIHVPEWPRVHPSEPVTQPEAHVVWGNNVADHPNQVWSHLH